MHIRLYPDSEKKRPPNPDRADIDGDETESKGSETV
jgi:hypothetical protein